MLLNKFFEITDIHEEESRILVYIKLDPNHDVYNGHFAEEPVAPGVFLIQMFIEVVGKVMDEQLQLESASNTKFTAVLDPNINPEVCLEMMHSFVDKETIKAEGILTHGDQKFFSMQGKFKVK